MATGLNPYNRSLSSKFILEKLLLDLETEDPQIPRSTLSYRRSTSVENALQIDLFMQNKANFLDAQMNVNSILTKDYERNDIFAVLENKANSNPIKPNFSLAQISQTNPPDSLGSRRRPGKGIWLRAFLVIWP